MMKMNIYMRKYVKTLDTIEQVQKQDKTLNIQKQSKQHNEHAHMHARTQI